MSILSLPTSLSLSLVYLGIGDDCSSRTFLLTRLSGRASRYAYVEFAEPSLVANAVLLNETMFRGRVIKVSSLPSLSTRITFENAC